VQEYVKRACRAEFGFGRSHQFNSHPLMHSTVVCPDGALIDNSKSGVDDWACPTIHPIPSIVIATSNVRSVERDISVSCPRVEWTMLRRRRFRATRVVRDSRMRPATADSRAEVSSI
jgi:hypothetical protein